MTAYALHHKPSLPSWQELYIYQYTTANLPSVHVVVQRGGGTGRHCAETERLSRQQGVVAARYNTRMIKQGPGVAALRVS